MTSYPASTKRPAATAESTPPLIAATTRTGAGIVLLEPATGERDAPANGWRMAALGEEFRRAREARGQTISDVAERLHIRSVYLTAIEDEDWAAIGAPVYIRGFMRTYARYLGLDPEAAVARFTDVPAPPARDGALPSSRGAAAARP